MSPSPPPAVSATYRWSLARCRAAAGRLRVAFRRCGAARRRPLRLRRRSSAAAIMGRLGWAARASQAARAALCRPPFVRALPLAAAEKSVRMSGRFLAFPACLSARKHVTRTPQARAKCRYAARVLGPRTPNTILRVTVSRVTCGQWAAVRSRGSAPRAGGYWRVYLRIISSDPIIQEER